MPTTNVSRAEPLLRVCCQRGVFFGSSACSLRRRSFRRARRPVPTTKAIRSASAPSTMSIPGLTVCLVVLSSPESLSQNTIASPTVMLVVYAPRR